MKSASNRARVRVFIDNDFSGDPDDLFQLAHHLLSPSVEVRGVIGSHLAVNDGFDPSAVQAENAVKVAHELLGVMGLGGTVPVYQGSNVGLPDLLTPIRNPATDALIAEALRDDDRPLFVACGAGLTELASALLLEPRIADRLTVIWIGGNEHPGLALPPPKAMPVEYNLNIDVSAGLTVFNHTRVPVWQVPRDVYRQCLVSRAELEARVRPCGPVGEYLVGAVDVLIDKVESHGHLMGETYALGDQPLVLLTALTTPFEPAPASSFFVERDTPTLNRDGSYGPGTGSRALRIFTRVDTRLLFEDLFLKLRAFADRRREG